MTGKSLPILLILALALPSTYGSTAAAPSQVFQGDSLHFPETGHTVKDRFLQYWQEHGGLPQQGYPISGEMQERSDTDGKAYTVQYFERAVFELHPENRPPYDVLLSLLGAFEYAQRYGREGPPNQSHSTDNPHMFPETGKTLGGSFRSYWETHGGLAQQGYPISEEFEETSALDGKTYTVQYFERAVFELHPENAGSKYEVLLAQLGTFRYARKYSAGHPASTPVAATPETPGQAAAVPPEATTWLREHAVPLNTAEPGDDYSDLVALGSMVGEARVVALGEATHGGHEFFTMKHRILRYMVQEMGFTVFAIEDGWAETLRVNDYVEHGMGTAEEALGHLNVVFWKTEEMLDLIRWMRAYNENRGSAPAITFQGVDMQSQYRAMDIVVEYLQVVDPPAAEQARVLYACFDDNMVYPTLSEETRAQCRAALQQVYDELTTNRGAYEARSSSQQFRDAQFSARIVLQSEERRGSANPFAVREKYMAENLAWVLDQRGPKAKAIVWAHNGHAGVVRFPEFQSMGAHLKDRYASSMVALGFSFYNGSFNARKLIGRRVGAVEPQTVDAAPPGSYGDYFHSVGLPIFLLDLRSVSPGTSATDWLFDYRRMWSIGSVVGDTVESQSTEMRITDTFDLVIHIDRISPTALR